MNKQNTTTEALNNEQDYAPDNPEWGKVRLIMRDDTVGGGLNGNLNKPILDLTKRTQYLLENLNINIAQLLTEGNILNDSVYCRSVVFSGAERTVAGMKIPAGEHGNESYIAGDFSSLHLRGMNVEIEQQFLIKDSASIKYKYSAQSNFALVDIISKSHSLKNNILTTKVAFIVPQDSILIASYLQIDNKTVLTEDFAVKLIDVKYRILEKNGNDIMFDRKFTSLLRNNYSDFKIIQDHSYNPADFRIEGVNGGNLILDENQHNIGVQISANTSGEFSYIAIDIPVTVYEGNEITVVQSYETSLNILQCINFNNLIQIRKNDGTFHLIQDSTKSYFKQDGNILTQVITCTIPHDINLFAICLQVKQGNAPFSQDCYFKAKKTQYWFSDQRIILKSIIKNCINKESDVNKIKTVKVGVNQQFSSIKLANEAVDDSETEILIDAGLYDSDSNILLKNGVILKANTGIPHLHFELKSATDGKLAEYQPLWINQSCTLDGLKITGKNIRYPIHAESNGLFPDHTIIIKNCHIEHYGNEWKGWDSQCAFGCGLSSGVKIISENNTYIAPFCAFSFHNNKNFNKQIYIENKNDKLIGTIADNQWGLAARVQPLGSCQADMWKVIGCELVGDILYQPAPWLITDLSYQPAAHNEIKISGYGNTPTVFRIEDFGRALKIESLTDINSSVSVSGTAVIVLFGQVNTFSGVKNLPAYVAGSYDISGQGVGSESDIFITSLGRRLGDCTKTSKDLLININGINYTVNFNKDYSFVSNIDILNEMNNIIGSVGIASEYAVGERYRPNFTDEEFSLHNNTDVGIKMGSLLAYNNSYKSVRLMKSNDNSELFAGVAWEDIYPGQFGRVKVRGYLPISDLQTNINTLSFNDKLSANDAGEAIKNNNGFIIAIRKDAVKIG